MNNEILNRENIQQETQVSDTKYMYISYSELFCNGCDAMWCDVTGCV